MVYDGFLKLLEAATLDALLQQHDSTFHPCLSFRVQQNDRI